MLNYGLAASVIVTCLDWVGNEETGRITCLMDKAKAIPIHGKIFGLHSLLVIPQIDKTPTYNNILFVQVQSILSSLHCNP